jgi:hypothetical protein
LREPWEQAGPDEGGLPDARSALYHKHRSLPVLELPFKVRQDAVQLLLASEVKRGIFAFERTQAGERRPIRVPDLVSAGPHPCQFEGPPQTVEVSGRAVHCLELGQVWFQRRPVYDDRDDPDAVGLSVRSFGQAPARRARVRTADCEHNVGVRDAPVQSTNGAAPQPDEACRGWLG